VAAPRRAPRRLAAPRRQPRDHAGRRRRPPGPVRLRPDVGRRAGRAPLHPRERPVLMTHFLGIETSCDETAAAVFTDDLAVLSSVVASQTDLHARFGGVVPEIASRAHLRNLLPMIDEALARAGVVLNDIRCVAVHNTPGLVGALLVGVSAAKALGLALGVPVVTVNHVAAHVFA